MQDAVAYSGMNLTALKQDFEASFGRLPDAIYFAPGRVNLIGEHIDYNGGRVMPAAIHQGTYFGIGKNESSRICIDSMTFGEKRTFEFEDLVSARRQGHWSDYTLGMAQRLLAGVRNPVGFDLLVASDLPQNSGLSSSASFCVGFGFALIDQLDLAFDRIQLARVARAVENDFVGVSCGIMDQFAVAMGKADHCIVLDCESLEWELIQMNLAGYEIVIANSMVERKLSDSNYNLRRSECKQALEILKMDYPVEQLCELSVGQVEASLPLQRFDVLRKRARHVSSENNRVNESVSALKAGALEEFGALMNASHASLRDDFEVSCPELDFLVETAVSIPGVLGSRMTGAGFGGCTVSLVKSSEVPRFAEHLLRAYTAQAAIKAEIYAVTPADGVKRVA